MTASAAPPRLKRSATPVNNSNTPMARTTAVHGRTAGDPRIHGVSTVSQERVRNFCIIAHIDHGKSTFTDRLPEFTNSISQRELQNPAPATMALEPEGGSSTKLQP